MSFQAHDITRQKARMKIEITKRDLLDGLPRSSQFCPLAYALRRQVPGAKLHPVQVGNYTVLVCGHLVVLPDVAVRFVKRYDATKSLNKRARMRPFTFDLPPLGDNGRN